MELLGTHIIQNLEACARFAEMLSKNLQAGDVIALSGELGAGKTTFTQFLGKALGVTDVITSPTYTFVGEYPVLHQADITTLIHMDLYRTGETGNSQPLPLNTNYIQEILDSAKQQKAVVVIEWSELMNHEIKNRTWCITIKPGTNENERVITVDREE